MKILLIDIETAPGLAEVWGLIKQNIGINQLRESMRTMCWAAQWYGDDEIMFSSEVSTDHHTMVKSVWTLLDEADAVVHYNGENFDVPTLNREFLKYDMPPPSPFKQIDLYKVAKSRFRFPSNKLDFIAQDLGLGEKHKHEGHELWTRCRLGDKEAWRIMEKYNVQDIVLLGRVYEKFRPWIKNHPNMGLYTPSDRPICTNCGSDKVHKKGKSYTNVGVYQRYKCTNCGTPLRGRHTILEKEVRKNILIQDKS